MPGYYGSNYGLPDAATIAAQQAAEKAATKKAAGPQYIPRNQRVQSGPQPAANFTPNAGNMSLVNQAYGNIGRASVGANQNQIDQGGQNYWMNQLNSGAISPQDFAGIFSKAAQAAQPATANMYQNQALSQMRGARPSGEAEQFYQPVYQPQYNNYVNPLLSGNVAAYGTNPGPSAGYMAAMAPGGQGLGNYYQSLQQLGAQQSNQPYGMDYAAFNPARKAMGASQNDLMAAYGYAQQPLPQMQNPFSSSGGNTLTPELAKTLMQRSMTTGLPYSESDKYGGYAAIKALYDKSGGDYSGSNAPYPQQQQPMQQQQAQFNPYTNQYQTPFSYQQPAAQPNYGPSQAIVGRSSQMRGTPNVMAAPVAKAKGGIASLLKKHK